MIETIQLCLAYVAFAAVPLSLGIFLLLWCVREFYVAGRGTLAPWDPPQHLVTISCSKSLGRPVNSERSGGCTVRAYRGG
jgi:hypothetical protein